VLLRAHSGSKARLLNSLEMAEELRNQKESWLRRRTEGAIQKGLTRAYDTVRVDPERFLLQLRVAYGLPIVTFQGVYSVEISRLDDTAESVIRAATKLAAAEGAGFGLGGVLTIVPDHDAHDSEAQSGLRL
jgi:hypothetical protein